MLHLKTLRMISMVAGAFLLTTVVAKAITWTGTKPNCELPGGDRSACGDNISWRDARNWSPEIVPGPGASADIPADKSVEVTPPGAAPVYTEVANLNLAGHLGFGALTVTGTMNWSGARMSSFLTLPAGATLNISGPNVKSFQGGIDNSGTINWLGGGNLHNNTYLSNPVITNRPSGVFNIASTDSPFGSGGQYVHFGNQGTIRKTVLGTTDFDTYADLPNTGTIDVQSGILQMYDVGLNTGTRIIGAGVTRFVTGGLGSGTPVIEGIVELAAGFGAGPSTFTGTGITYWTGGGCGGPGLTIAQGHRMIIADPVSGPTGKGIYQTTLTNKGTVIFDSAGTMPGDGGLLFDNQVGAVLEIRGTGSWGHAGGNPSMLNSGTLRKTGATAADLGGYYYTNAGTEIVEGGTIRHRTYTQTGGATVLAGGTLINGLDIQSGSLSGFGTVDGGVSLNGALNPGAQTGGPSGILNITGDLNMGTSASLNSDIGGITAGTQFDQVRVTGRANVAGTLNVRLINNYAPAPGAVFPVLTAGSLGGTFSQMNTPAGVDPVLESNRVVVRRVQSVPLPVGLIAWYRGEGNSLDQTGQNPATARNITYVNGKVGRAFNFNGTTSSLQVSDSATLHPTSFTIEGWFNLNTRSGVQMLVSKPLGTVAGNSFALYYNEGTLRFYIADNAAGSEINASYPAAAGTWHHVAATFNNSANTQTIFVDGAQVATGTTTITPAYDTSPVLIGYEIDYGQASYYFPGKMDELAFFNRALTATEIGAIANAGSAGMQDPNAPTITSFTPTSGMVGTSVIITGTRLTGGSVFFNGVRATVNTNLSSATRLVVTVPTGATTGTIRIVTATGTATSIANFTVTPTPNPAIVTNTNDSGAGSLRAAIVQANIRPGTTIRFNIPASRLSGGVVTISPDTALPAIRANGTRIDGTTQTAFSGNTNAAGPEVVIKGDGLGAGSAEGYGLVIGASNCLVKGLIINGFAENGVSIGGNYNQIEGCYIGTGPAGTIAARNFIGISVSGDFNVIGGTTAAARNVISGNQIAGIRIDGATTNSVLGNYIGTNAAGTAAIPNGIGVDINAGTSNVIGGVTAGTRNIISGNRDKGIQISNITSVRNVVAGNTIGLNAAGTGSLGNAAGVVIFNGKNNTIGGELPLARNVISGNIGAGVAIGTAASGNLVLRNYIGTNVAGTAAIGNGEGVSITGAAKANSIGNRATVGSTNGTGNVISGNTGAGVSITGVGTDGNIVIDNFIGTNNSGTTTVANRGHGVAISGGAKANRIGQGSSGFSNLISGNGQSGVVIVGAGTDSNLVLNNYIGLNRAGGIRLGNSQYGVSISGGARLNRIGLIRDGGQDAGNVIAGSGLAGVRIAGIGTNNNDVQNNFIGTNNFGTLAVANTTGVLISEGARNNLIGGVSTETDKAGNVISGNSAVGVEITGIGTSGNFVRANRIGLIYGRGIALPNGTGVILANGASSNLIGFDVTTLGTGTGLRNLIGGNRGDGIEVRGNSTGNRIHGNNIDLNGGLGIDLVGGTEDANGVTGNDLRDGDTGANALQNHPTISSVTVTPVTGTTRYRFVANLALNSTPNRRFLVAIHHSPGLDRSGHGEGTYLGAIVVTTNAAGDVSTRISNEFPVSLAGQYISALATDLATFNTSEFGRAVRAVAGTSSSSVASALSSATASAASSSVQLRFQRALNAESAGDVSRYAVSVNGKVADVETAAYDAGTHTVTLALSEGSIGAGDVVAVQWGDLLDDHDATVSGQTNVRAN